MIVPDDEYTALKEQVLFLLALKSCGVNNWDGYGDAITLYQEWLEEENG